MTARLGRQAVNRHICIDGVTAAATMAAEEEGDHLKGPRVPLAPFDRGQMICARAYSAVTSRITKDTREPAC